MTTTGLRRGAATMTGAVVAALLAAGLAGCATASRGEPIERSATGVPIPPPATDLSIRRTFALSDGMTATCTIDITVEADPAVQDPDAPAAARSVLAATDWQTVPVSLDQMPLDEQTARRAQGVSEAELLAMILQDDIHTALTESGSSVGVQTSAHTVC